MRVAKLNGVILLADGKAYEVHAVPGAVSPVSQAAGLLDSGGLGNILRIALLAFAGGVVLNLMPCVFPVLFIKGLSLLGSSTKARSGLRAHGAAYTLGILVSFWAVVAVLLGLRATGDHLGWGFQFQSPTFIAVIALLLFFLGLSLAGMFEIGLTLTGAGSSLAAKQGYAGSFFTGVLATIVATPCTAPFMGTAVGFALAQSAAISFVIFTALALGLAAPYVLLTLNPAWTRLLPRPGAWMEILKQAMAVPIFGTVIWLVWLFTQSAGVNVLPGLLTAFLLLAAAGWILGRWPARRVASVFALLVVVLAIAVPVYVLEKFPAPEVNAAEAGGTGGAGRASGEIWQPFSAATVENYRAQGRPVFVDFTADWCLSCQVNERIVLDRPDVQQRLRDSGLVLVRADWTRHDDSDCPGSEWAWPKWDPNLCDLYARRAGAHPSRGPDPGDPLRCAERAPYKPKVTVIENLPVNGQLHENNLRKCSQRAAFTEKARQKASTTCSARLVRAASSTLGAKMRR